MILKRKNIFLSILFFILAVNLLIIFEIDWGYLRTVIVFIFLLTIPGLLIMLAFKIFKINPWIYLILTLGLSIGFMMFAGLLVNWIIPLRTGIIAPLSTIPLLISFDIFLFLLWLVAFIRNENIAVTLLPLKLTKLDLAFFITLLIFPLLSVFGSLTLNNGGPNTLTMIMIGGIAVYFLTVVLIRNRLNENIFPFSILIMSVSLLLSFSLRSYYVSGWDIFQEFYVFQLTKAGFIWNTANYPNAYNACLSITILPAVLSSLLHLNDHYIYKLLFQLMFSFTPVGVFLIFKKYSTTIAAFIASFFFISQSTFFAHLPLSVRQEAAFLFFTLAILIMFFEGVSHIIRITLFSFFGISLIVSHYSSAYIGLTIFILAYVLNLVSKKTRKLNYLTVNNHLFDKARMSFNKLYKEKDFKEDVPGEGNKKYFISGISIIFLFVFAFSWFIPITKTSGDLVFTLTKTLKNMGSIFDTEVRDEGISLSSQWNIFFKQEENKELLLKDYVEQISDDYKNRKYVALYETEKFGDYSPVIKESEIIPLNVSAKIASNVYVFMELIKKIMKGFIIIGILYAFVYRLKGGRIDKEYLFLCLIGIFTLIATMVLPAITIEYSLDRLYLQILVFLSLMAVIGGIVVFRLLRLKGNALFVLLVVIIILYYLFSAGFIPQVFGGTSASLSLDNYGSPYEGHYTHKTEVVSVQWLKENYDGKSMIYGDIFSKWRLMAIGGFTLVFEDILPQTIDKNSYVYLRYTNVHKNNVIKKYKESGFAYNLPADFLNDNKNLIYNNGGSKIFK